MKKKYKVTWVPFVLTAAVFAGATLVTIHGLTGPERGEEVKLYRLMEPFYNLFGYWPTMLLPPVLGICCLIALYFRKRRGDKDCA